MDPIPDQCDRDPGVRPCLPWADPEWVRLVAGGELEGADRYLLDKWRGAGERAGGAGDGTR